MAFLGQEQQMREYQERFRYLYVVVFLGLGLLLSRLIFLQILRGEQLRQYSEENRIKRVKVEAPRGMIYDRNHTLLIDNRPAFDLEVIPQYLNESRQKDQVIQMLARVLKMSVEEITAELERAKGQPSFMPVKIKTDLTREEVAQIETWRIAMPGVEVREEIKRTNLHKDIAAHLLGYIGEVSAIELPKLNKRGLKYRLGDVIGKGGLEQRMEDTLRGAAGEEILEVDALGRVKIDHNRSRLTSGLEAKSAVPGRNLVLTVDEDLQETAADAMGDKIGAVVAIDPRNGQILTMLSRPSFDPTEFSRGIPTELWTKLLNNENHPMFDKTIQEHYSPGSTFKVITAIAALEEGLIDGNTRLNCPGWLRIGNRIIHCDKRSGHGDINVVSAITQSCDVFFYKLSQKFKSVDEIAKWATHLGFGHKTGINLSREVPGLIPTEEWKRKHLGQVWNPGETASVAIGQSYVLVTALQLANSYAALANGGTLFRPSILKTVEDPDGKTIDEPKPEVMYKMNLKPQTVDLVKQGLWGVVNSANPRGTAYLSRLPGMDFVGKTGTVQVIRMSEEKLFSKCSKMRFQDRHNSMFVGFAPAKDPVIAVSVVVEHGCAGAVSAAPVARAVIKKYLEKYFPDIYGEQVLAERLHKQGINILVNPTSAKDEIDDVTAADEAALPAQVTQPPPAPPRLEGAPAAVVPPGAPSAPDPNTQTSDDEDDEE